LGFFQKVKDGLQKTHNMIVHEVKRIVTLSPKLTVETMEELEAALLAADLGTAVTSQIVEAARIAFESQGRAGLQILDVASAEVEKILSTAYAPLRKERGLTVVSLVGVN